MSRTFAVTSSTSSLTLDPQGRGKVTFTVTHTGQDAQRLRGRLVPEGETQAAWLSLVGESERPLEVNGTEQFSVDITAPSGTASGSYSFRFDAISVENPDDDSVEGPSVAVQVVAAEQPKASFPWWILLVVGGLLLAGAAFWFFTQSGPPELGEACDGTCAQGLLCSGARNVCVGNLGFEGCGSDDQCEAGLSCFAENGGVGRCVSGHRGKCNGDVDCGEGLACQDGSCLGGVDFNPCTGDGDCVEELWCQGGSCRIDATEQPCTRQQDCGEGLQCVQVASQKICLRAKQQMCSQRWQCASQICTDGICESRPNGAACENSAQCDSGICDQGRCRAPIPCSNTRACPDGMTCWQRKCIRMPVLINPQIIHRLQTHERLQVIGIQGDSPPPPQRNN